MVLDCLPCREDNLGENWDLPLNVWESELTLIISLDRVRFMSCTVYLSDNSLWKEFQESSVKNTGPPGVWLHEFWVPLPLTMVPTLDKLLSLSKPQFSAL